MSRQRRFKRQAAKTTVKRAADDATFGVLRGWLPHGKNLDQTFRGWEVHAEHPGGAATEVVVLGVKFYETLRGHAKDETVD